MARKIKINDKIFLYRTGFSDDAMGGSHWTKFYEPSKVGFLGTRFSRSSFLVCIDIDNIYHKKSEVDEEISKSYNEWKNSLARAEELKKPVEVNVEFIQS